MRIGIFHIDHPYLHHLKAASNLRLVSDAGISKGICLENEEIICNSEFVSGVISWLQVFIFYRTRHLRQGAKPVKK